MHLDIIDLAKEQIVADSYEVVVETYMGDADGWENIVIGPFKPGVDDDVLEYLLVSLEEIAEYWNDPEDMGNAEGFQAWFVEFHVEHDEAWFRRRNPNYEHSYVELLEKIELVRAFMNGKQLLWPKDPISGDDQRNNSYEGYNVYYYDADKSKFEVAVTF